MTAIGAYYRSRPLLLSLGLTHRRRPGQPARPLRRIQRRPRHRRRLQPARKRTADRAADVGRRRLAVHAGRGLGAGDRVSPRRRSSDASYDGAIAVALGGEASVATNGFWSSLTMATTLRLPMLFYIEDNGLGISVRGDMQTPGGNIARNLASFSNLLVRDGDGSDPA